MDEVAPRFQVQRVLGKGSYGLVVRASVPAAAASAAAPAPSPLPPPPRPPPPPAGDPHHSSSLLLPPVVAIKRVRRSLDSVTSARRVLREVRLLRALGDHDNVTSLLALLVPGPAAAADEDNEDDEDDDDEEDDEDGGGGRYCAGRFDTMFLVMEAADCDLFKVLTSTVPLAPSQARRIMRQVLVALEWLHRHRVAHRDIKPANILVNDCRVQLADFQLSRWLPPPATN